MSAAPESLLSFNFAKLTIKLRDLDFLNLWKEKEEEEQEEKEEEEGEECLDESVYFGVQIGMTNARELRPSREH